MKDLSGKVAVVTGAASGIGLALSRRFGEEGMKVVMADIEAETLDISATSLRADGIEVMAQTANVMSADDLVQLADRAFATFGNVHVVCNNAGVASGHQGSSWELPPEDWEWLFGVNFMGVLNGLRAFVPRMLAGGEEGHIVNTASILGLLTNLGDPYSIAKHSVVALSEGLYRDLKARNSRISASVLCPGTVNTNILDAERNRPARLATAGPVTPRPAAVRAAFEAGLSPAAVAEEVVSAILEDRFYIIPAEARLLEGLDARLDDIRERRNPRTIPMRAE